MVPRHTLAILLLAAAPRTPATALPVAQAGDLLVASRFSDQVLRYDLASGAFLGVFASGGGLDNPVGLTYGPDGALYVVSADSDEILRYDGNTGAFLGAFVVGPLLGGRQLNFGPQGDLYLASGSGDRILRYDGTSGVLLGVAAQGGGLDGPTSFTFGPGGDLYVGSVLGDAVLRFDGQTGAFEGVFAHEHLDGPHDVAFGPEGHLYVSNAFGSEDVVRFDGQTGAFLDVFVVDPGVTFPLGLTWTSDGGLLVANQGGDDVRRYDARTGALDKVLVGPGSGGLDGPMFSVRRPQVLTPTLFPLDPGLPGSDSWLALEGAQPGAQVRLFLGRGTGLQRVRGCPGLWLGLSDPLVLGHAWADESGSILLDLGVPATWSAASVFLQAVDHTTCTVSPLLVQSIP